MLEPSPLGALAEPARSSLMAPGESMDLPAETAVADLDAAFAGNRLLATLDVGERALLEPHMRLVTFTAGERVFDVGAPIDRALFPFDSLMVSMMVELNEGRSVEVASIGKEGALGGIISCGAAPAFTGAVVQIAGLAVEMPLAALQAAKATNHQLHNLFCRYSDFLLSQVMQSVACNSFHAIEARTARWLLHAQDRVSGDRIALTQESLAGVLGVQRTTVNAVARELQGQGLITYRRAAIRVADRPGLARVACECYGAVEGHFASVVGHDGRGGTDADCS
jgi:CRP-like cAMP-binding protein